jgi:hypothetical protein
MITRFAQAGHALIVDAIVFLHAAACGSRDVPLEVWRCFAQHGCTPREFSQTITDFYSEMFVWDESQQIADLYPAMCNRKAQWASSKTAALSHLSLSLNSCIYDST